MTATNEATDETLDGTPVGKQPQQAGVRHGDAHGAAADTEGVAEAAARDVARLLDRRGLREVVALAHRVLRESTRMTPAAGTRPEDGDAGRCTLRQHERSTRWGAAGRAVDDDRA